MSVKVAGATRAAAEGIVQPVLDPWGALTPTDFPNYRAGTATPSGLDRLPT